MNQTLNRTADADEVAQFSAIAEEWWDPAGKFKPLHQLAPIRLGYIRDHVIRHFELDRSSATPFDGLTILDVGCGGGLVSEPLARLGAQVTAIDASDKNIAIARLHAEQGGLNIDFRQSTPEALMEDEEIYDVVVSLEVIEHVADLNLFLGSCAALTRPGGAVILSTINRTVKSLALAKFAAEYILRWLPAGTHDWKKFVKPSELSRELRQADVNLKDVSGMSYDVMADIWQLSRDLDMNYMAFAAKD